MPQKSFTAIVKQRNNWWVGWIKEIPGVNCQEKTKEELLDTLKITLEEALELNRQDAIKSAENEYEEVMIQV